MSHVCYVRNYICVCVRACVRACVRSFVRACVGATLNIQCTK